MRRASINQLSSGLLTQSQLTSCKAESCYGTRESWTYMMTCLFSSHMVGVKVSFVAHYSVLVCSRLQYLHDAALPIKRKPARPCVTVFNKRNIKKNDVSAREIERKMLGTNISFPNTSFFFFFLLVISRISSKEQQHPPVTQLTRTEINVDSGNKVPRTYQQEGSDQWQYHFLSRQDQSQYDMPHITFPSFDKKCQYALIFLIPRGSKKYLLVFLRYNGTYKN